MAISVVASVPAVGSDTNNDAVTLTNLPTSQAGDLWIFHLGGEGASPNHNATVVNVQWSTGNANATLICRDNNPRAQIYLHYHVVASGEIPTQVRFESSEKKIVSAVCLRGAETTDLSWVSQNSATAWTIVPDGTQVFDVTADTGDL